MLEVMGSTTAQILDSFHKLVTMKHLTALARTNPKVGSPREDFITLFPRSFYSEDYCGPQQRVADHLMVHHVEDPFLSLRWHICYLHESAFGPSVIVRHHDLQEVGARHEVRVKDGHELVPARGRRFQPRLQVARLVPLPDSPGRERNLPFAVVTSERGLRKGKLLVILPRLLWVFACAVGRFCCLKEHSACCCLRPCDYKNWVGH
jgi:hypothetical protein